jgi:hypothetical protein
MPEHHIQHKIIAALVESQGARFAELRPAGIETNSFTYHLQQLMKDNVVEKSDDGLYRLTPKGKLVGIHASESARDHPLNAHSIILIVVRDGARWLLRKRLVQPLYGKTGFIHGEPLAGQSVTETAQDILIRRTGLRAANIEVRGSGFIVAAAAGEVESYSHFVLVEASEISGELIPADAHGENRWIDAPDFSDTEMIGSMPELTALLDGNPGQLFFTEITISA